MMLPPERETPKPLRGGAVTIVDGVVMCPDSCGCICHTWGARDRCRCISCGAPWWAHYEKEHSNRPNAIEWVIYIWTRRGWLPGPAECPSYVKFAYDAAGRFSK